MILSFVYKLLYGGCVTVTAGCILNCLLEHVVEFTVVRKVEHIEHSKANRSQTSV